ncbi:MAG: OmpA family protein [Candidatus Kapabacteria bacterium]|nr:OmpA family protein [Candidatus Kapabacteria bacterium]
MKKLNNIKNVIITTIIVLIVGIISTVAAEQSANYFGAYAFYQYFNHKTDIKSLSGCLTCNSGFNSGTGSGLALGLFYKSQFNENIKWQLRLGYSLISGKMQKSDTNIGNVYIDNFKRDTTGSSEYILNSSFNVIELSPLLSYQPFSVPFNINLGLQFKLPFSSSFDQSENLIYPNNATFENGLKVRNQKSGKIENTSPLFMYAFGSLSYDIKLDNYIFSPEIGYGYDFNDFIKGNKWKADLIRIGLSFAVNLHSTKPEPIYPAPQPLMPSIEKAQSKAYIDIIAHGLYEDKHEDTILTVKIEEYLSRQAYPILPYIFFSENSDVIPIRYSRMAVNETSLYNMDKKYFNSDNMTVYYDVLNILGNRLRKRVSTKITLTGCNADTKNETGNIDLSLRRAESVRKYLFEIWGIDTNRILIKSLNLPDKFTKGTTREHQQENRRVEISSDDWDIIKPLIVYDTLRQATPPMVKFYPVYRSESGIAQWEILAGQNASFDANPLKRIPGFSIMEQSYTWDLSRDRASIPRMDSPLLYRLNVVNQNDEHSTISKELPVEQITLKKKRSLRVNDIEIDEFRLIMFDYDSPQLTEIHKKILELVCESIKVNSKVIISGFTDKLGNSDRNKQLSDSRAMSTKRGMGCKANEIIAVGEGETDSYYDEVPEGRFYSRYVHIRVETPVR